MTNKFTAALKKDTPTSNANAAALPHERPARRGTKHVGGYFTPEVSKQLRQLAANEDTSIQNLLAESLDMLFHSRKMPMIAQKATTT